MIKKEKKSKDIDLISKIVYSIEEVKGDEIKILDLRHLDNSVCDYFLICNGTSNIHVRAIVSSIKKNVSKSIKEKPLQIEGLENANWVLIDYVNIVVHVFQKYIREYYNIEAFWGDAKLLLPNYASKN